MATAPDPPAGRSIGEFHRARCEPLPDFQDSSRPRAFCESRRPAFMASSPGGNSALKDAR